MTSDNPKNTQLYRAMLDSGRYSDTEAAIAISEMRNDVLHGENPEELLHEEGFEPDYIDDITP